MGDTEQVEREVEHLRVVITRLGSAQSDGKSEKSLGNCCLLTRRHRTHIPLLLSFIICPPCTYPHHTISSQA